MGNNVQWWWCVPRCDHEPPRVSIPYDSWQAHGAHWRKGWLAPPFSMLSFCFLFCVGSCLLFFFLLLLFSECSLHRCPNTTSALAAGCRSERQVQLRDGVWRHTPWRHVRGESMGCWEEEDDDDERSGVGRQQEDTVMQQHLSVGGGEVHGFLDFPALPPPKLGWRPFTAICQAKVLLSYAIPSQV